MILKDIVNQNRSIRMKTWLLRLTTLEKRTTNYRRYLRGKNMR